MEIIYCKKPDEELSDVLDIRKITVADYEFRIDCTSKILSPEIFRSISVKCLLIKIKDLLTFISPSDINVNVRAWDSVNYDERDLCDTMNKYVGHNVFYAGYNV